MQSNASTNGGQLSGVVAPAAGDVWTVGARYKASGYSKPMADLEHWTGSGFSAVPPPAGQDAFTYLYGMTALSASDIWAVGGSQPASGTEVSYVIHYDGSAWSMIPAPNVAGMSTNLDAVAGSSANDVLERRRRVWKPVDDLRTAGRALERHAAGASFPRQGAADSPAG